MITQDKINELKAKLNDPFWRINNLYYIKDKSGNKVLFNMNKEQEELLVNMHYFNIVPKARQLGITTFFCILYFDQILFNKYKTAGIIAHTREQAKKIFKDKIKFAWDNLPEWLRTSIGEPSTDTTQEMTFPNGSTIFVSTSTRGGTCQYLHISEFGFTCQHFPDKAEEIVSGAINTVQAGQYVSIESTAEGKEGYFYEFCMEAKRKLESGEHLSELEFKLFFFPWFTHYEYRIKATFPISTEYLTYFKELEEKTKIKIDDDQRRWYIIKHRSNKDNMLSQYPSTMDEAFQASIQGAYYATHMSRVYMEQRIRNIPIDSTLQVDTWWDLGMNDENVIIFTQSFGPEIRIIDVYSSSGEGLAHYIKILREKGYVYGTHTLPHDVEVRELGTGVSRKETLVNLGLGSIRVCKKFGVQDGIEKVRSLFSRFFFDETRTKKLYTSLPLYRKEWDEKLGVFKDKPRHDANSHFADALRVMCLSWVDGGEMGLNLDADDPYYLEQKKQGDNFFTGYGL